jgi:hypothetical protein
MAQFRLAQCQQAPSILASTALMGDVMDEIPKEQLDAIRQLNDADLIRLITEISAYGWPKSVETLKLMIQEKTK